MPGRTSGLVGGLSLRMHIPHMQDATTMHDHSNEESVCAGLTVCAVGFGLGAGCDLRVYL